MICLVQILYDISFQQLMRCVFIIFLKQFVLIAHLTSFGKLINRIAALVSIKHLPCRIELLYISLELLMWCWQTPRDDLVGTSFVRQICSLDLHS